MFGWRARIGCINPGCYLYSVEWDKVMPEGVVWAVMSLGVVSLTPDEFNKAGEKMFDAGKILGTREVGSIFISGTPMCLTIGYEKSMGIAAAIQKETGVRTALALHDIADALKAVNAKKIAIATPYSPEINEMHVKFFATQGLNVVSAKGLTVMKNVEITKLPPYASYRLGREAISAAPDVDAVWVGCPAWPVVSNVAPLERDTGIPVVSDVTASLYCALKHLGIKSPVKGFGKLLEAV